MSNFSLSKLLYLVEEVLYAHIVCALHGLQCMMMLMMLLLLLMMMMRFVDLNAEKMLVI